MQHKQREMRQRKEEKDRTGKFLVMHHAVIIGNAINDVNFGSSDVLSSKISP